MQLIDTHTHLDGAEFENDLPEVVSRAIENGIVKVFVPAIDLQSSEHALQLSKRFPHFAYAMIGLHPEEVKSDYKATLTQIRHLIDENPSIIGIGEVGLDFYWSREFEKEQLDAFETQVRWSVETRLPLMIHCRKAQNEMVSILKRYKSELAGGIFHCFTGNEIEAKQLLEFDNFGLGIGGVLTFKKSLLPTTLPACVPLDRIVLETDSPYMAPVPHRGQRNESAFVVHVAEKLAESYGTSIDEIAARTTANALHYFPLANES